MKFAGIDIGTTTISLVLLDGESGQMLKRSTIEHGSGSFLRGDFKTSRIQDPERICTLAATGFEELTKDCDDLKAIGLTGQMHGMLYVDRNGRAVSPLYTWKEIQTPYYKEFADWLDDDAKVHSCNIETAYHGYEILEAICLSALNHTRVDLPITDFSYEPVLERMKKELPAFPGCDQEPRDLYKGDWDRPERD